MRHSSWMTTQTVFAQVIGLSHRETFRRCVQRYQGDAAAKGFGCHDKWLGDGICSAHFSRKSARPRVLAALADRAALSDGFRSDIRRSTLADANELRDWRIYAGWAQSLILRRASFKRQNRLRSNWSRPFTLSMQPSSTCV